MDVESHFTQVQLEATEILPTTDEEQKSMEALTNQLKEGIQAIACCQKRIKVAEAVWLDGSQSVP